MAALTSLCLIIDFLLQLYSSPYRKYNFFLLISSLLSTEGDGSGSFILKNNSDTTRAERMRTAKYSIALQYLVLEGVTEDEEQE